MLFGLLKNWFTFPTANLSLSATSTNQSLISRIFALFRRQLPQVQEVGPLVQATTPIIQETSPLSNRITSSNPNKEMQLSLAGLRAIRQLSSAPRTPSIKFIGNHGAVPRFNPSASPSQGSRRSQIAQTLLDESELPPSLRRRLPSPEEIDMVNSGGLRKL